jgi:hypothetical protein
MLGRDTMKFHEALGQFMHEIEREYGVKSGLVKISVTQELISSVISDLYATNRNFGPLDLAEMRILGVDLRIERRMDDK